MSAELLRVIGVQKTNERGEKYYQAIIGRAGFRQPWGHRVLRRKCKTWTQAHEYGLKAIARLGLRAKSTQPRAKKVTRFS